MTYQSDNSTITKLVHAHAGRPAVVLGGGYTLPDDMVGLPADAVHISANEHGCKLRKCDYIVCCDEVEKKVRPFKTPIIGTKLWADYRIFEKVVPNSGALACMAAWVMGCSPIIIAGCSLYQGATYWHDHGATSTGQLLDLDRHLARWSKLKTLFPNAMFRVVSGPLEAIFPLYNADELVHPADPPEIMRRAVEGMYVTLNYDTDILHGRMYKAGTELEVHPNEFKTLAYRRMVRV